MRRSASLLLALAGWWLLAGPVLADPPAAGPAPAPAPAGKGGPAYVNDALGVRLAGPAGWKMATSKSLPAQWSPLVTFYDPATNTEVTLHTRPRRSATVADLRDALQKEWAGDRAFSVVATRVLEGTPGRSLPGLVIEATQTVAAPAPAPATDGKPGAVQPPAAAPVTLYVVATYWLGSGHEFLLYGQSRSTLWSRMRPLVDGVRDSFLVTEPVKGPEGEGAYQDDARGFSCRFPKGYTVRVPARKNHVVEFAGVSAEDPVLGIYHFASGVSAEQDAQSLVAYYKDEQGGEASAAPVQVAGLPGTLVTARAPVGGKEQTFFVAVAKRGGEVFRVRCACPKAKEAEGKKVFEAFLAGLTIGAPKAAPTAPSGAD